MAVTAFLYDADGHDCEVPIGFELACMSDRQLLWLDLNGRDARLPSSLVDELGIAPDLMERLADPDRANHLDNYGSCFAFVVDTPCATVKRSDRMSRVTAQRLAFVVSQHWLITAHATDISFLSAFHAQDKGETRIGVLTPSLLAASLLDWHLAEFFTVASQIESYVDQLDERILSEGADRPVLNDIVAGRKRVAELRVLIARQRPVFHGLTRPDFALNTDGDAANQFGSLADRYDRAVDEVERTREVVVGSFDLFTSMSSEETNDLVKALTFVTAIIGFSAAVAGLLGMNFDAPFFKSGLTGFIVATGGLIAMSALALIVAKFRRWI